MTMNELANLLSECRTLISSAQRLTMAERVELLNRIDDVLSPLAERPPPSNAEEIVAYLHCGKCLAEKPDGISPQDWGQNEVGYTPVGLQVWCKRHRCNVVHIDFERIQHPANMTRPAGSWFDQLEAEVTKRN